MCCLRVCKIIQPVQVLIHFLSRCSQKRKKEEARVVRRRHDVAVSFSSNFFHSHIERKGPFPAFYYSMVEVSHGHSFTTQGIMIFANFRKCMYSMRARYPKSCRYRAYVFIHSRSFLPFYFVVCPRSSAFSCSYYCCCCRHISHGP